jgi:phosphatidylserine/phosphatidylglycerophosphate/cardiolipin synthase-like enzyme
MVAYAEAVDRLGWLMDALEDHLENLPDRTEIDLHTAREVNRKRRATTDEATAALEALVELGALVRLPGCFVLNRSALEQMSLYRAGVRAGLVQVHTETPRVALCVSSPHGLPTEVETVLRQYAEDLRGVIVDLVAAAREDLVMASPFWDRQTLDEIGPLLLRRLEDGVRVRLLGRFGAQMSTSVSEALAPFTTYPGFRLVSWYHQSSGDPFASQTFHFKAAVADRGARAYLGTANFTVAGLRSRLEIGVLLEGETARRLSDIINVVLALGRPVSFGVNPCTR